MWVNLEMEGYTVREAGSAEEGLRVLEETTPNLVLLDVMMPEVDGWEMLQRVQERHGIGTIPVIMFSGKVDEQAADEAASRGAQGFIGKPFNPQELIDDQTAAAALITLDRHLQRWVVQHRVGCQLAVRRPLGRRRWARVRRGRRRAGRSLASPVAVRVGADG